MAEASRSTSEESSSDDPSKSIQETLDDMDKFLGFFKKLQVGSSDDDASEETYPKVLRDLSVDSICEYINSEKCQNIITMCGAGLSTAAGIPDFRSPGSGLYSNLGKYNLPHPQAIFEINYFRDHPEPFFEIARQLYPGKFKPTTAHYFIKLLDDKGYLLRNYTQNVDALEVAAGLDPDRMVEAHGTFRTSHCVGCKKAFSLEWMKGKIFDQAKPVPKCDSCSQIVKPDIVFFGEALPKKFFELIRVDFERADLLIIMGTSLQVQPFASLVSSVRPDCPRLLVNLEKTGEGPTNPLMRMFGVGGAGLMFPPNKKAYRDVFLEADCNSGVRTICQKLGWEGELQKLEKAGPTSSSRI